MTTHSKHALSILTVPAFNDNYLWLIHDGMHAVVVDPGDGRAILAALKANNLVLSAILLTHHHADHTGGVPELLQHYAVPVFGPSQEIIANVTHRVSEGDAFDVPGLALRLAVLDVPGHTSGHIAYVRQLGESAAQLGWLFCGDTLFAGGCGRLFEGTPEQMVNSLSKLSALPDDTLVYCAHEYTLANLRFARAVEPGNSELIDRVARESAKRATGQPTIPSTIGIEKATNPFLRCNQQAIVDSLIAANKLTSDASPVATFAALRRWKDTF
jgi:hydroxyacylglutathione hydrolase